MRRITRRRARAGWCPLANQTKKSGEEKAPNQHTPVINRLHPPPSLLPPLCISLPPLWISSLPPVLQELRLRSAAVLWIRRRLRWAILCRRLWLSRTQGKPLRRLPRGAPRGITNNPQNPRAFSFLNHTPLHHPPHILT